jgi:transcriptional regulator with XRE-family HTH domain
MSSLGARLKKIRDTANLSQEDFGAKFGVSRATQVNYEGDKRPPDANYLAALFKAGHDITYIVTGVMQSASLSEREAGLIHMFRRVDVERQEIVLATLRLMAPQSSQIGKDAPQASSLHDRPSDFHGE